MSKPLNLLEKVIVQSTRQPHDAYNGLTGTVTRRVIHAPGITWEYDVHPFSSQQGVTFIADDLRQVADGTGH